MTPQGAEKEAVRVKGLIIPASWGPGGEVTRVLIASFDDNDYLVGGHMQERLLSHMRQVVEAVGYLHPLRGGGRFLDVRSAEFPPDDAA